MSARAWAARAAWSIHPGRPHRRYSLLDDTQWWEPARLRELQLAAARSLLLAAHRVPLYYERLRSADLAPEELVSHAQLMRIEPLERDELVRLGPDGLSAARFLGVGQASSGSSGKPAEVRWPLEMLGWVHAVERRAGEWLGRELGERGLAIGVSRSGVLARLKETVYNIRLVPGAMLSDPDYARALAAEISRRPPEWIAGLSNGVYSLARLLLAHRRPVEVGLCMTGGNHLPDHYRRTIESAFGCRVRQAYASVETGLLAHECPAGQLHVASEAHLVEIVRDDGSAAAPGEAGHVLITTLRNRAMPLIRYRIGDLASLSALRCTCGRGLPVLERLVGRNNELVHTVDGRRLMPEVVSKVLTSERSSVLEYQIVQRPDASLDVQVIQRDAAAAQHRQLIAAELDRLLGRAGMTRVERVDRIPVNRGGKLRHIVSEIDG